MARFKVLHAAVNRIVDGNFVSHRMHEIVDLSKEEARRLLKLKAVAPVDEAGNVTELPAPDEPSPHLEPDLEDGQDTTVKPAAAPEPEPEQDAAGGDRPAGPPRGNASLEDWTAYAKTLGASDEDLADMSRDQIRDQYGQATA